MFLRCFRATSAANGPASRRPGKQDAAQISYAIYPPRFEVCGGSGWDNLGDRRQRPHLSRSPTLRRSGSVREAHSTIPAGGITRTRAARAAAELSGLCPRQPVRAGCSHPVLYRTHHRTILNRDRHTSHNVHCPKSPVISGLLVAEAAEKTACPIRNRAETAACAKGLAMPI